MELLLLRFTVAAAAVVACSLALAPQRRRVRAPAEALFFSVLLTDWLFAGSGVAGLVMRLVDSHTVSVAAVTLDAFFHLALLAALLWTPLLAAFVLSGGSARFFVRTSWLAAWMLGGVCGMARAAELQELAGAATATERQRSFFASFQVALFGASLATVGVAACVLYGRKWGFLAPSPRLLAQEKLLQYVLAVSALQLPYMASAWIGRSTAPDALVGAGDCLVLAVPVLNACVFGLQPACWRVGPPTAAELLDKANAYAGENVTLEELDGLTDVAFVAEGAGGAVYKAQWLGIEVAMKVLKLPNAGAQQELYETLVQRSERAFIDEASICARLRHPNVTLFIRAGHYQGKLGILTEYCARGSLKDVLKAPSPLPWHRKVALALHVAKGLTYLHARNPAYIHRDLKGSNILVTDTWQAKLADFGISRVANFVSRSGGNPELTIRNNQTVFDELTSFAGTWRWNAPEILADPQNCRYSRATDMFSFGMVLWEIATDGEIPFSNVQFDFEVRDRVVRGERPRLGGSDQCPEPFATLITTCWSQDPTDRPSATQATARLTALLASLDQSSQSESESSSILVPVRDTRLDRDCPHSLFGARLTNLLRGRFSARSSSTPSDETFAKYASPFRSSSGLHRSPMDAVPILGLPPPPPQKRGLSRGFALTLPSLSESDMDAASSDRSTTFSSSSAESIMSPIVELPVDAMLEAGESFIDGARSLYAEVGSESALAASERDDSAYEYDSVSG
ncbi:hypothetical protein PybrP1_000367, partial [[Pythium] brassicae (nom. inval.)]